MPRPIDADALIAKLEDWRGDKEDVDVDDARDVAYYSTMSRAIRFAKDAPTLDYAPVRHGEWVPLEEPQWNCFGLITIGYKCSECGREEPYNHEPYCHCGALMDGKEDSDETN